MNPWIICMLIGMVISILCPVFTYAIYPGILLLLRKKQFSRKKIEPNVTVIALDNSHEIKESIANLEYSRLEVLNCKKSPVEINKCVGLAKGEIIVFTDFESELDSHCINEIVCNFADNHVGTACGILSKKEGANGAYWKYENKVKYLESGLGKLSGANKALFAIRKEAFQNIPENCINVEFFLATAALQNGWFEVFDDKAKAYELPGDTEKKAFRRHVLEARGYYQALTWFWKLLIPFKWSFTYIGHRVMKWLVPWNMIFVFLFSVGLSFFYICARVFLILQILGYLAIILYHSIRTKKKLSGPIVKLFDIIDYFMTLNFSYLVGCIEYLFIGE